MRATRMAFLAFAVASTVFLTQAHAKAQMVGCESFGDITYDSGEDNCYPDMGNEFCEAVDVVCWENAPWASCESAWYSICLDIADPCLYWCCCRVG
jgi:hypothetical protein